MRRQWGGLDVADTRVGGVKVRPPQPKMRTGQRRARPAPKQLQLLPALSPRLCTDTQSSQMTHSSAGSSRVRVRHKEDTLTLSVIAVSEGCGNQRALWEQACTGKFPVSENRTLDG